MRRPTHHAAAAALPLTLAATAALLLAACADAPPTGVPTSSAVGAPLFAKAPAATDCSAPPAKAVQLTAATLALTVGQSAEVTACSQYFSDYTVTNSAPAVATVAPSGTVTPTQPAPDAPYAAELTITAVSAGQTTITVTDKKGNAASVVVTVTAPTPSGVITFDPGSPLAIGYNLPGVSVAISEAGYTGGFAVVGCSAVAPAVCDFWFPTDVYSSGAVCGHATSATDWVNILVPTNTGGRTLAVIPFTYSESPPALSCTVTVQDALGNTAYYTVNATP